MDLLYIAGIVALWLITVGLGLGCEKLRRTTR